MTVFLAVFKLAVSTLAGVISLGLRFLDLAYSLTTASVNGVMLAVADEPCVLPSQMEYIFRPSLSVTDITAGLLSLLMSMLNFPVVSVTAVTAVTVDGLASKKVTVVLVKGAPVATVPLKSADATGVLTGAVTGVVTGVVTGAATGVVTGAVTGAVVGVVAGVVAGAVVGVVPGVLAGVVPGVGVVNGVVRGVETGAVAVGDSAAGVLSGAGVGAAVDFSKLGSGVEPPPPQPVRITVAAVMSACERPWLTRWNGFFIRSLVDSVG